MTRRPSPPETGFCFEDAITRVRKGVVNFHRAGCCRTTFGLVRLLLRSSAARRTAIDLPQLRPPNQLPRFLGILPFPCSPFPPLICCPAISISILCNHCTKDDEMSAKLPLKVQFGLLLSRTMKGCGESSTTRMARFC
jgi:hypothetical protein